MEKKIGLIVEGGGMRGAYTAGVLDAFDDHHLFFPYIVAVSAGANTVCSYLSKQKERNNRIYTEWITDKRFIHVNNLFKEGCYFGMQFLFEELPLNLDPFDFETFKKAKNIFKVGTTHCKTGKAVYFEPLRCEKQLDTNHLLQASSSLPLIAKPVLINGDYYLDGGIVDAIPIEQSIKDGNTHHVIVLTRNASYRKKPSTSMSRLAKLGLKQYPEIAEALRVRHLRYNATLDKLERLEKEGKVFVFRPQAPLKVDRYEKNPVKLKALFKQGYDETVSNLSQYTKWLDSL
ncbi:patatin-like phospholipase family protein [Sporanaerobium hydrogeniformans]|uniref:patatin-like phospholipase family protein n=1 Tax=Sporanaerobium hydrogeniformans TaxID=3072179 RepID=UPI0015D4D0D4|nr:patatin family protein [Sporanaerobium hydrogeniformans]